MIEQWPAQYDRLCRETDELRDSGLSGTELTEACFKSALLHWTALKERTRHAGFADDREEMLFFKTIKPQFTGQLEFYTLLYNYLLFHPVDEPVELAFYCRREQQKINRFRHEHQAFLRYCDSGKTDKDALFFLRRNHSGEPRPYVRVFDQDPELATAYDWILSLSIGNEQYDRFLIDQLDRLGDSG